MAPRHSIPALASLVALALLLPRATPAADRGAPTCADAWTMIDLAASRHVLHDKLTPELAARARDLLVDELIEEYPWLTAGDVAALRQAAAATQGEALLAERAAGRCDHLEAQRRRVGEALARAAALFSSPRALARALPARLPPAAPPSHVETPADLGGLRAQLVSDAATEAWRVGATASWDDCRAFGARRALRWLSAARARLADRGTADLVNAFAHALDPHSRYETEEEADHSDRELNPPAGMLGLEMGDPVPGGVPITAIFPGSPAARLGWLKVGDVITAVGDVRLADRDTAEVSGLLDQYEERVPLTVSSRSGSKLGRPRHVTLTRQVLEDRNMSVASTTRTEQGRRVQVIRIDEVAQDTAEGVERALRPTRRPPDAVLLDLRSCTGGYLTTSVAIAGLFLEGGPLVRVHRRDAPDELIEDPSPGRAWAGPVVVLVSEETASGCEIVAAALRARGRALVVGTARTFGKGTMQEVFDDVLPTGALYVTTGIFFMADGRSPQGTGVPVDVVVTEPSEGAVLESALPHALPPPPQAQVMTGWEADRDPVVSAALAGLRASEARPTGPSSASDARDPTLARACALAGRFAAAHAAPPGRQRAAGGVEAPVGGETGSGKRSSGNVPW
jgi:carboxyl-terminal processing protease